MLGRGLESLIPSQYPKPINQPQVEPVLASSQASQIARKIDGPIFHIEVEKIESNPHQPRKVFEEVALKELAASISEYGIMQPLVATKIEIETASGVDVRYQLIAGERRLLAARMIGLPTVPVIVKVVPEEREKLELAIVENLQRANLNPVETARAYAKLQDHFGLTQREIAAKLGKTREVVGNSMRLLSLPTYIQDALSRGQLNESQGRLLLAVDDQLQQQNLFNDILKNNLSARELKNRIERLNKPSFGRATEVAYTVEPELREAQERLQQLFGTKVELQKKGSTGKILIDFYSNEELQNILRKLLMERTSVPQNILANEDEFGV
jgi:ParB family chromosome partitioning protein